MYSDNSRLLTTYNSFEKWLNKRSHRQRLFILLLGWLVIYLLWNSIFEKPLRLKRINIISQITAQKTQLTIFQREINHVQQEGTKMASEQHNPASDFEYASAKDNDEIIRQILTPQSEIKLTSLKAAAESQNTAADKVAVGGKSQLEITFNSNYFETIAYLTQLEKLPWCLSWDSLKYQVDHYPNAQVVINMHIVNNYG